RSPRSSGSPTGWPSSTRDGSGRSGPPPTSRARTTRPSASSFTGRSRSMRPSRPHRETDVAHWIEVGVGVFMLAGVAALAYLSINLGKVEWFGGAGYSVYADFPTVGGLKKGA